MSSTDLTLLYLITTAQISYFQPLTIINKPVVNILIEYMFSCWANIFKAVFLKVELLSQRRCTFLRILSSDAKLISAKVILIYILTAMKKAHFPRSSSVAFIKFQRNLCQSTK